MAVILAGAVLMRAQPQEPACVTCIDPAGTQIPTCTLTPIPRNPKRYTAGTHGMVETGAMGSYSWNPYVGDGGEYERIPMVKKWLHLSELITNTLTALPQDQLGGNSDWLLTFNEPLVQPPAGCDMTMDEVVLGLALIEAAFPDRRIVSPAYSSDYDYTVLEDVRTRFIEVYGRPPRWDALAFHCYFYGSASSCTQVVDWYIAKAAEWGVEEVWCTEFASLAYVGTTVDWSTAVATGAAFIDYMDAAGVNRWFWYGYGFPPTYTSSLVDDLGALTPLGEMYRSK